MSSRPSLTVTRVTPDANADSASARRPPESSPGRTGPESSPASRPPESSPGITGTERILSVRSLDGPGARQDQRSVGRQANAGREPPDRSPALGEKTRLHGGPVLTRFQIGRA